jgi:hypothetical protein
MSMPTVVAQGGAVVYHTAGPTRRELLETRLAQIGLEKFTPPPRSDGESLKLALGHYADDELTELRRQRRGTLKDDTTGEKVKRDKIIQARINQKVNGYEVVDVERKESSQNDYCTDFAARMDEHGNVLITKGYANSTKLQELFAQHKAILGGNAVGRTLVEIIAHLKGTTLREAGGVYWLPEESIPTWHQVIDAFQASGTKTKVYCVRTVMDSQTVRAVKDAIVEEVMGAASILTQEITSGSLGERAIEFRKSKALALHARVSEYEGILNETLTTLHEVIKVAEVAAASAVAVQDGANAFEGMYA